MKKKGFIYRLYALGARLPRYALSGIGMAVLFVLTLIPASDVPSMPPFPMADKIAHALAFGLVAAAIIYDRGRRRGSIDWRIWVVAVVIMTITGALVELLQWRMGTGRSGDIGDLAADFAGAALLPLLLWPLLRNAVGVAWCDLDEWRGDAEELGRVKKLYMEAFPPEERRDWAELESMLRGEKSGANLLVVRRYGRWSGFITWWRVGGMRYVEHFAIDSSLRGSGIGAEAIRRFTTCDPEPVVLEVEPAGTGDMARRRIAFYERCGFESHPDLYYFQPPYSPCLEGLELMLMTSGDIPPRGLQAVAKDLIRCVYGAGE